MGLWNNIKAWWAGFNANRNCRIHNAKWAADKVKKLQARQQDKLRRMSAGFLSGGGLDSRESTRLYHGMEVLQRKIERIRSQFPGVPCDNQIGRVLNGR